MAKKDSVGKTKSAPPDSVMSLFDSDNLEFLDALQYNIAHASATTPTTPTAVLGSGLTSTSADTANADHIFELYRIADDDESWGMGELNVKIMHRGRIRISRTEWRQVVVTCSDGFVEDGIRKDFHLNILLHPSSVRLIYISYRYKQFGDKQRVSPRHSPRRSSEHSRTDDASSFLVYGPATCREELSRMEEARRRSHDKAFRARLTANLTSNQVRRFKEDFYGIKSGRSRLSTSQQLQRGRFAESSMIRL
jgi:hypothetical protein